MILFLTLILVCQLAGELLVAGLGLPVPGPVIGMALLFLGLAVRGGVPDGLAAVADGLLRHLALLFVPAGVGVMLHAGLLGRDWLAISITLVASTALTVAVTGAVMAWLAPRRTEDGRAGEP